MCTISCIKTYNKFIENRKSKIPYGYFCYEDITSEIRIYCEHLKPNSICGIFGVDLDEDLIKECKYK